MQDQTELVALAIGLARPIPFQVAGQRFAEDFREGFFALNLSALPPTMIESELFGQPARRLHGRRG